MQKITLTLAALALAGCASPEYAQYSKAQTDIATARHAADTERYKALAAIAASGDSTAKVAAVIALAVSMAPGGSPQSTVQAPQASQALQWASILVPGLTQVAGMRYQHLSAVTQSNNATALGVSTNGTFASLASNIQAPGSVTTNTLSGTGTLGSGAYSTQDRHDVTTPAPVVVPPVVQVVPTVITPTVITPLVQVVPIFQETAP